MVARTEAHEDAPVVGALFEDRRSADAAALAVRQRCAGRVDVVRPHDRRDGSLLRTAWRWHGWYLPAGVGAGLLIALARVSFGGPQTGDDPWPLALFLGGLGLVVGALMALFVTARPQQVPRLDTTIHEADREDGHWAVVAHPQRAADAGTARAMLVAQGGDLEPFGDGDVRYR